MEDTMALDFDLDMNFAALGSKPDPYDVIIIGGGPGGTAAAIYTARSDLRTLVIDKGLTAGALGITSKISNYPGVPGTVTGAEIVETMRRQAEFFGAEFLTDKVVGVDLSVEPRVVFDGCLSVDNEMQTNVAGIYAVGDLLCTHVKQAVIAAADGVIAAVAADKYVHGRKQLRTDWN